VPAVTWRIDEFAEVDSTNRILVERARAGEAQGLVVRADFQSAGRGRLDRTWEAPARSSLLTSLLLRPDLHVDSLHFVTAAVALSARDGLTRLCGLRPELKWPNDLLVGDRKLGGILAEVVDSPTLGVVVGLGLNLSHEGPPGAGGTSVRAETGVGVDPRAALDILLDEMDRRVGLLANERVAELREEYAGALATIGRRVRVERHGDVIEGVASAIDAQGRLAVEDNGVSTSVSVGDVVHLRATEQTS
jgi:BirA family biotin operon repressor/biotin-[acetyl-CoA-carboxylase] ligase